MSDDALSAAPRELLRRMFDAAVAAAQPALCLPAHLPRPPAGRVLVVGAGKASAEMARVLEDHWHGPLSGLVVTRYGHAVACRQIEIVEAAHPVPDAAGQVAAQRMLSMASALGPDDLLLCLLSGGGSALLPLPLPGLSLADKQAVSRTLLACGASISEINCLRRHLSAIKGGRLAAACHPAPLLTLAISDVPGDDPADIASGPTAGDPSSCADALAIVRRHALALAPTVRALLESGAGESIKPGDPRLAAARFRLIATPHSALQAAAAVARAAGVTPLILGDNIEGEAREVARCMAGVALSSARHGQPQRAPCVLLSGGETTVTVRGRGCGGRNVEFLLALALALGQHPRIWALAADTDGIDGAAAVAGAFVGPDTLSRSARHGLDAAASLADNDAHGFFAALGDQLITGPTLTNVNDFRAILLL